MSAGASALPRAHTRAWVLAMAIGLWSAVGVAGEGGIRPEPGGMPTGEWSGAERSPAIGDAAEGEQRVTAEAIRASLEDQLVAGVARPKIDLNIQFEFASAELTDSGRRDLDAAGDALTRFYPESRFELAGHTDASGPADYNLRLSVARAEAARQYLLERHDISPDRLKAEGFGESQPIPGASADQNRRVVLELLR